MWKTHLIILKKYHNMKNIKKIVIYLHKLKFSLS